MKHTAHRLAAVAMVLVAWSACASVQAMAETLRYRRVYAPADRPDLWPRDGDRYVPIDAAEFEELIRQLRGIPPGMPDLGRARLAHAEYEARLIEPDLLQGRAILHFQHDGGAPVLARLDGWGLALEAAAWEAAAGPSALIGSGPDGTLLLLVDRPGKLVASWTLRGQAEGEGAVSFPIALAKSAVSSLALELPLPLAPAFSAGVSREVPPVAEGWRRWRVDLGGTRSLRVLVAGSQTRPQQRRLTLVEEQTTYDLSPRGADVLVQFKLDVHHEPLQRLTLTLDPGVELVSVRYAEAPLAWKLEGGMAAGRLAAIDLPEPMLGSGRVLRVAALAPLPTDVRWRLPRVRVEEAIWQAGRMNVLVRAPLVVNELEPVMCRQSRISPLAGGVEGEMLELEAFSPDAALELSVTRPALLPEVQSAAVVSVAQDELRQHVQLALSWSASRPRTLELHVAPGWLIEDVAGSPPDALGTWEFLPLGKAGGVLRLPVSNEHDAARPVRLTVRGRRPRAAGEDAIPDQVLEMLRLPQARLSARYLLLRSLGPYELHVEPADEHEAIDRSQLAEPERAFFEATPGVLLRLASRSAPWHVRLVPQPARYRARIQLEARVTATEVQEHGRIQCVSGKAPLDRVLVHFTQAGPTPPQWTLDTRPGQTFAARRLPPEETAALALDPAGETWELALSPAHESPLLIEARRVLPRIGVHALGLVCVPQAEDQQGLLLIRSTAGQPLHVENTRLTAATPPAADGRVDLCAALRYDPAREAAPALQPAVRIHPLDPQTQPPRTYVSDLRLDSFAETSGCTRHRLTGTLRNGGVQACTISLPPGASVLAVRVNGKPQRVMRDNQRVALQLDSRLRWQRVQVHYETMGPPLGLFTRWHAGWPSFDLPVAQRSWTLWLPPAMLSAQPTTRLELSPRWWLNRLLGGLARQQEPLFHPLSPASWRAAFVEWMEWLAPTPPAQQRPLASYSGWQPTVLAAPSGQPPLPLQATAAQPHTVTVWVTRRATRHLANLSAFLAAIALVRWRAGRRAWFALWLAVLIFMALILPDGMHSVPACAMQGTLLALAWNLIYPRRGAARPPLPTQHEGSGPRLLAARAGALSLLLAMLISAALAGQPSNTQPSRAAAAGDAERDAESVPTQTPTKTPPVPARVYQVLIPVDDEGRPTGDRYHVPEEFRNRLRQRAMQARGQARGWLLEEALYTGTLVPDAGQTRLRPAGLTAMLTVRVFEPGTRLAIAFGQGDPAFQTDLATLDGNPIEVHWDAAARLLRTEPLDAGEHLLKLPLMPRVQSLGLRDGILIACPRLCRARLNLVLPADVEDVLVPEARGAQGRTADGRQLWAALGPLDEFSIRWLSQVPTPAQAAVTLEQLLWLKVQPGSVGAEVRFRFDLQQRQLDRLRLLVDQRLRILPLDAPEGQVPALRTLPREPRLPRDAELVELEFPQPLTGNVELAVPFLVVGTAGAGNVRLPRIEVLDAVTRRLWLGVFVDPALEYTPPDAELAQPVKAPDFAAAWGADAPPLDFAVELQPGRPLVSIATRRRSPTTNAEQELTYLFGAAGASVEYTARLETSGGVVFQHHLDVPPEFEVDQVSLLLEGRPTAMRWARTPAGGVALFLKEPASGVQELRVQGWLPAPNGGKLPLTGFRLRHVATRTTTLHVRREGAVQVVPIDPAGVTEIVPPAEGGTARGWPVKSYVAEGGTANLAVQVLPNQPRLRAAQATWIERTSDGWMAHVALLAEVSEGQLDQLRLEIPAQWHGPFEVLSATGETGVARATRLTTGTRHLLLVRLRQSLTGTVGLHVRGAWHPPAGEAVAVPHIILLGADAVERYVLLPRRLGRERARWSTDRLLPEALPAGLSGAAPSVPYDSFRVLADPYRAMLGNQASAAGQPRVRHAETLLTCLGPGICLGRTTLDVEPAGAAAIVLHVPRELQLLHCTVEGVDAALIPKAPAQWEVPLAQALLPLRLELGFTCAMPPGTPWQPMTLVSPSPVELPVSQWLWVVRTPDRSAVSGVTAWRTISAVELERQRLRNLTALLAGAADPLTRRGGEDAENWYRIWASRLRDSQLRLLAWSERRDESQRTALREEVARSVREQDALALRVKLQHIWQQVKDRTIRPQPADDSMALWEGGPAEYHGPDAQQLVGESQRPHLELRPPRLLPMLWYAVAAVLLSTAICAALVARRCGPDWGWRWSRLLLTAAGVAWWLWLRPPHLGLLIALLALLAGVLPAWRRTREPGSTLQVVSD